MQRLAVYFIKNYIPELYKSATHQQATAFFKRQGRALTSLCQQCGTVALAIRVIDLADKYYNSKNPPLDWNLNTVDRNLPEFLNTALLQEKKENEKITTG